MNAEKFCSYGNFGVCRIKGEVVKSGSYYTEVQVVSMKLNILIPKNCDRSRDLVSQSEAKKLKVLLQTPKDMKKPLKNWNQRHREYMAIINNGNLDKIVEMVRELEALATLKAGCSFSEKKLLEQAHLLVSTELDIVLSAA